jgi:hypothetical protein
MAAAAASQAPAPRIRARLILLAASPSLAFLTASLGWALLDRLRKPLWTLGD